MPSAPVVRVHRRESVAAADAVNRLLSDLDARAGVWLGCDVDSPGLYDRHSVGFDDPALLFSLDGTRLRVRALNPVGLALLPAAAECAGIDPCGVEFECDVSAREAGVIGILRTFMARFSPGYPELGLYGAWSFDYFRLGPDGVLPNDARRRLTLYFPHRVLRTDVSGSRWVEFEFPELPAGDGACASGPCESAGGISAVEHAVADELPPGEHARRVQRGIDALREGRVCSLVLSQAFRRRFDSPPSRAFSALRQQNPYPAMFFLNLGEGEHLFGASPDLQVRADRAWIESAPVCGTVRRGADPVSDADQALVLLGSDKEAAALAVCVDSDLADKARVCIPNSLELLSHRRPYFFTTIIHTVAHTRGMRAPTADVFDILLAHATPATVTGVPKKEAVDLINALEPQWRGWYGGAVGRLGTDGSMEVYTVLRAARVRGNVAEVRAGGNLLVDSDPRAEEDETRTKAEALFRVLAGERVQVAARPVQVAARPMGQSTIPLDAALIDLGDPWRALLTGCIERAGVRIAASGRVTIVTDGIAGRAGSAWPDACECRERALAVGLASVAMLRSAGAKITLYPVPRFARTVTMNGVAHAFLGELGSFRVGMYGAVGVREEAMPPGWEIVAIDGEGWVMAAQHPGLKCCCLLFRPDVVQSSRANMGERSLRLALDWLAQ